MARGPFRKVGCVAGPLVDSVPFGGDGIHQDVSEGDWDAVRRRTYEGRGE